VATFARAWEAARETAGVADAASERRNNDNDSDRSHEHTT
jgi:hypothetical protein